MAVNRRIFLGGVAAGGALLAAPVVLGQTKPRVVVIGGGPGGATAAHYLAKDSNGELDVVLIDSSAAYTTCFFSNLYIGGLRDFESITHGYDGLIAAGVQMVIDHAAGVDRDAQTVTLAGGDVLSYDRLVLSPGIDFVEGSVLGWSLDDADVMPHAYKAGPQTQLLKSQLEAMPEGGTFLMVAPPNPYRCPPGPYERVSMVAWWMQQNNPTAKIIIADPKPKFSKQGLFEEGWETHYPGMIERIDPDFGGDEIEVHVADMAVDVGGDLIEADVVNVIPAQVAGQIAQIAGVTNDSGWAPVRPDSMKSAVDDNVYVLGDSAAQGDMPKSGFSANSQAKVAAMMIRGELLGASTFPARYTNTCWSLISENNGVKVGASYEPTDEKIAEVEGFVSQTGEDAALRQATYEESLGWYAGITADMFG